ncbi:Wzz/FepE/Etk N-terminal domain-containing protein [Rheinheimera maricola]|uniref:Polysaccharide chain length determinant N-terminal domain-containing protein n=1 Tax=Rheinheimera maricola TaxID=2793282 RepID=A0ABS7X405_9GAMM|nr:Wzz/FepE/Etk N-terminal domain-containing protein [Rheinheimera maricola]MBZ9610293.1 hypothetical protein [Rheinheimera maricola]
MNIRSDNNYEINLADIWQILWRAKIFLLGLAVITAIVSICYVRQLANIYEGKAVLVIVNKAGSSSLARLTGQLGGLASLAGINLADSGADKSKLALEIAKSREFIYRMIVEQDMLVPLMAATSWDPHTDTLYLDERLYHDGKWVRDVEFPFDAKPSRQEALKAFDEVFFLHHSKEYGTVTITFQHYSATLAAKWANAFARMLDNEMKQRDVREAQHSLQYLQKQLEKTELEALKLALYQLIEEQSKTLMLAEVSEEYVFKLIDPAVRELLPAAPKRTFIVVLAILLVQLISCFIILLVRLRQ